MINIYNSELVSKLYKETDKEGILEIIREIEDSGDQFFIYPLLDGYDKHRKTSFAHYFLFALTELKGRETAEVLEQFIKDGKIGAGHFSWTLEVFNKLDYYTEYINHLALEQVKAHADSELRGAVSISEIDLDFTLSYLKGAQIIEKAEENIKNILFLEKVGRAEKRIALSYFIRINPTPNIAFLIEQFSTDIKGKDLEMIVTKEILLWKGSKTKELKALIFSQGSSTAKSVVRANIEEKEKKAKEKKKLEKESIEKEVSDYTSAIILDEIRNLRKDINLKTVHQFEFNLLPDSEMLLDLIKIATDESSFRNSCSILRSVLLVVNDKTKNHNLKEEEMKALLPSVAKQDFHKPLNSMFLYLITNEIGMGIDVCGLRDLNRIAGLLSAHQEKKTDTFSLLKKMNLLSYYKNKKWAILNKKILEHYKECLSKLDIILSDRE